MTAPEPPVVLERIEPHQSSVLDNLFELYVYDFSEQLQLDLEPGGRFGIQPGDEWWTDDDHHPFLIRCGDRLCGFALVRLGSRLTDRADVMDVAEFFVLRGARKQGVGKRAAHALFATFEAPWEVRVRRMNPAAMAFWSRTLEAWAGRSVPSTPFVEDTVEWTVFRLDSSEPRLEPRLGAGGAGHT